MTQTKAIALFKDLGFFLIGYILFSIGGHIDEEGNWLLGSFFCIVGAMLIFQAGRNSVLDYWGDR